MHELVDFATGVLFNADEEDDWVARLTFKWPGRDRLQRALCGPKSVTWYHVPRIGARRTLVPACPEAAQAPLLRLLRSLYLQGTRGYGYFYWLNRRKLVDSVFQA